MPDHRHRLSDTGSIAAIARQAFPKTPDFLVDAHEETMKAQYSWLLVDFHPKTPSELWVRSGLLPDVAHISVFRPS